MSSRLRPVRPHEGLVGQRFDVTITVVAPQVGELVAHGEGVDEGGEQAIGADRGGPGSIADQQLKLAAGFHRPHVGGRHQRLGRRPRPYAVESQAERRGAGPQGTGQVCRQHTNRQVGHGGEHGGVGLLDVGRRSRCEEAGADSRSIPPAQRAERGLAGRGQSVLVVVGDSPLSTPAAAPHLRHALAREAIARHVACHAGQPDLFPRHRFTPPR